jgi:hypothetical protein
MNSDCRENKILSSCKIPRDVCSGLCRVRVSIKF